MATQTARYRITGTQPLIMHNGQLADPLNPHAKALKKVTSKKKKVDADHEEMAKIEFLGSLYTDKEGRVVLPWYVVEASLIAGAKRSKEGQLAKSGISVKLSAPLVYEGPKTGQELWDGGGFTYRAMVRNQMVRVARTRPKFEDWSAQIEVEYDDTIVEKTNLDKWMVEAGRYVGVGDWRPRHGTFSVKPL